MNLKTLLFSLDGRINRAKWWLGVIGVSVVSNIVTGLLILLIAPDLNAPEPPLIVFIIYFVMVLFTAWLMICIYAKRWHDLGKSGWWTLILFVPLIGFIWALVECGCFKGTEGANKYGEDPLA